MRSVAENGNDKRISEKLPNRINPKKFMPRYITIKFLKIKTKGLPWWSSG